MSSERVPRSFDVRETEEPAAAEHGCRAFLILPPTERPNVPAVQTASIVGMILPGKPLSAAGPSGSKAQPGVASIAGIRQPAFLSSVPVGLAPDVAHRFDSSCSMLLVSVSPFSSCVFRFEDWNCFVSRSDLFQHRTKKSPAKIDSQQGETIVPALSQRSPNF